MVEPAVPMRVMEGQGPDALPLQALLDGGEPVLLKGLCRDWGLVQAGRASPQAAVAHLLAHYAGAPVPYSWGPPETRGRPFYDESFTRLNTEARRGRLDEILADLLGHLDDDAPPTHYIASVAVDDALPGLRAGNDLDFAAHGIQAPPTIWIGNRTTASCHYDLPSNIACCAVGRRRFTLFPPEQVANLYPGPLEPSPGGQAVSIVDFDAPDFARFPRFRDALAHARVATLEPGDAIFVPSMWWHHVQGLSAFNVLVNFWWHSMPGHIPTPMHALYHAMWTLRDRPEREKQAWRALFDYYVFGPPGQAGEHLPEAARQVLGPIDDTMARRLRALLVGRLNR